MATNNTLAKYPIGQRVILNGVCGAMLSGRQGVIVRNGGVAYHVRLDEDEDPNRTFQVREREFEAL